MFITDAVDGLFPKIPGKTRFVVMSDTHGSSSFSFPIPDGDIFIHAGDLTRASSFVEFKETINWIKELPHKLKIVTAGNHDHVLDEQFGFIQEKQYVLSLFEQAGIIYLEHEPFVLPEKFGGYKTFVSPYAPIHCGGAFMPNDLTPYWEQIPLDTQILVTHTPPRGYNDKIRRGGLHVGCPVLREKVDTIKPLVHIFGHIHEGHGWSKSDDKKTVFVNACTCNHRYRPNQRPWVFDL